MFNSINLTLFCRQWTCFYFIPGAISVEEQCHWIRESLTIFPQPPNRTNHNAIYGPITNLFVASRERKVLVEEDISCADEDSVSSSFVSSFDGLRWTFCEETGTASRGNRSKSIPASVLLRKLRWSTLGLQFDWSKRNYDVSLPHNKIPDALAQLAKKMAAPAMPLGQEFQPEAAIGVLFILGDTLGGHLDDMEADWSKPIVSMSLGCKAIFLLGGKSRQDLPQPMFLRSGDVVLMAGEARECFHGVPRIFTDEENSEMTPLELHLSHPDDICYLEYIRKQHRPSLDDEVEGGVRDAEAVLVEVEEELRREGDEEVDDGGDLVGAVEHGVGFLGEDSEVWRWLSYGRIALFSHVWSYVRHGWLFPAFVEVNVAGLVKVDNEGSVREKANATSVVPINTLPIPKSVDIVKK
ncbi:hypothetical protein RHSIM_Rhsim12G0099900 [Rhododendron simsii]|uniref:Alpha-ketoglutarate-dependent dioxygenase AlkB-like domain-containing protein n=1 Tax=Rhododendron simsii TaxID=118357 RepID=A0A834L925_RHOSS|nr:hypothetical protein RHSIM_Rhsim12G0099900 [Rhododendron simsii]